MSDFPLADSSEPDASGGPKAQAASSRWKRFELILRMVVVRLRFFVVLIVIFAVLASWERMGRLVEWAEARLGSTDAYERSVSPDTEYFCPMCPGVLSTWPEKCPVCKMPLVRRQKGEAVLLPEGVLARMQLSPYRIQLAGIQTTPVQHLPLARSLSILARVTADQVDAKSRNEIRLTVDFEGRQLDLLRPGRKITVGSADKPAETTANATVIRIEPRPESSSSVVAKWDASPSSPEEWQPEALVNLQWQVALAELEPYRSQPRQPEPRTAGEPRELYVCHEHLQYIHLEAGKCPFHDAALHPQPLRDDQRLEWFCPAHPSRRSKTPTDCEECSGLPLIARIVNYSPDGKVLAIPESSVIDTGERQWVFVESSPGMFDAIPVLVGERTGSLVPVIAGLDVNQRVVSAGAFLLDAETRLSPNVAASYFGAGPLASNSDPAATQVAEAATEEANVREMGIDAGHLARIERQAVCPVTKFPLGSMGAPTKVRVGRDLVYLCCEGCLGSVRNGVNLGSSAESSPPSEPAKPALEADDHVGHRTPEPGIAPNSQGPRQ